MKSLIIAVCIGFVTSTSVSAQSWLQKLEEFFGSDTATSTEAPPLFGVKLYDDKGNYDIRGSRAHPFVDGYFQAAVEVPLRNNFFDDYALSYSRTTGEVEQIFSGVPFGDFELCKASVDGIVNDLKQKFGRGFEKYEGAVGTSYRYGFRKVMDDGKVIAGCSMRRGLDIHLWVDLRTHNIADAISDSNSNF